MNVAVIQEEAIPLLDEMGIRSNEPTWLYAVDSVELGAGLCVSALHAGATLLNLTTVEDIASARSESPEWSSTVR